MYGPVCGVRRRVLHSHFHDGRLTLRTLDGNQACQIEATPADSLVEIQRRLLDTMGGRGVDVMLPVGAVLAGVLSRDRNARLGQFLPTAPGGSGDDVGSRNDPEELHAKRPRHESVGCATGHRFDSLDS